MYCYKPNLRLLNRLHPFIKRTERNFSVPVTNENKVQSNIESQNILVKNELVESKVQFPPILDLSRLGKKKLKNEEWHTKVKNLSTVEEKIFELNMPRYYGWKLTKLEEGVLPYNPLPFAQYVTRTYVFNEPGLPSYYDNIISSEEMDILVQKIKSQVEDVLIFEYMHKKNEYQFKEDELEDKNFLETVRTNSISQQISRILTINLSSHFNHLLETQTDIKPRIEAFWFFGGFEAAVETIKARLRVPWLKKYKYEQTNESIKYYGRPMLQLRHNLPLKEIVPLQDAEDLNFEIPEAKWNPRKQGYFYDRLRATIIPGFWPGDHDEFGIVSYHNRAHLNERPDHFNDNTDALTAQAIYGSFSWLYGQACYQGFSTFQDPTYPLVNQLIISNGQWWSFSAYQLNTTTMHIECIKNNKKRNLCWITEPMKLFDTIEDGKIQGFNDEVLKYLIKFYANTPAVREGVEMKPYLGKEEKVIADIKDVERRIWLEQRYKHLVSNRSRHRLTPEIYHWQKIYMINHKTRSLDKKFEPWEFGINRLTRRLDDHTPEYIPKCYRSHPKSKKKWRKNYYPEVRENKSDS